MKTIPFAFLCCLLIACNSSSSDKQSEEISEDITDTLIVPLFEYDYSQCIKAWSLEEALATPDSFCSVALLADTKKYTSFPNELATLPYLRKLDVHGNQIKEIPDFLKAASQKEKTSKKEKTSRTGMTCLFICKPYRNIFV